MPISLVDNSRCQTVYEKVWEQICWTFCSRMLKRRIPEKLYSFFREQLGNCTALIFGRASYPAVYMLTVGISLLQH
ncbi:hypothetical protein [Methanosarcina sp. UBA289]|uniref:hypothetical protein n=1 Tax=Methanosarcina sp. UBA289 TaxID=1915574 RepID=UPI0025F76BF8|nr:hypothetical protein [Methanosarcina sp. UBA289]